MRAGLVGLALALAVAAPVAGQAGGETGRRMAITIDDLPVSRMGNELASQRAVTRGILAALRAHDVRAVGFVNEDKLERDGVPADDRIDLLRRWLDAGQELGNHTYGHPDLHRVGADAFIAAIARGERITRPLATAAGAPFRWFRHPFLHTGRDSTARAAVDRWLDAHGYRVAPVTVDNYDYQFANAYDAVMARGDTAMAVRVATAYLDYMEDVVAFYEAQSRALHGREIPQVLLLHANALNAARLDQLLDRLEARSYTFVPLEEAVAAPAYDSPDRYFGPAGLTWLHRWAITADVDRSVFAGEPEVPAWVVEAGR